MPDRVTLRTIATQAGVHISTVSRVLSQDPHLPVSRASEATAARIRQIAADLDYQPDLPAASLRTQRTRVLGVLVPRLTDVVLATIYEGVEEEATAAGYQTVVANTRDDPAEQQRRVDLMICRRVDGLILGDAHLGPAGARFLDELAGRDVPFVLTNRRAPHHVSLTCDDVLGGRLAGEHLAALGHRQVGIVAGLPFASTGRDRTNGFVAALRDHGIAVPKSRIVRSGFDVSAGKTAAATLLDQRPAPTAIFAVNDFAAVGVMGALTERNLRPGHDVAVIGFNDISIAGELPVPLSTIRSPMREMGAQATRSLLALLSGAPATSMRLTPHLVVRESTDPTIASAQSA